MNPMGDRTIRLKTRRTDRPAGRTVGTARCDELNRHALCGTCAWQTRAISGGNDDWETWANPVDDDQMEGRGSNDRCGGGLIVH